MVYCWGGRMRKLPESFIFGKMTLLVAFLHWCVGNDTRPPLRNVNSIDFSKKNVKLFCEYKFVMKLLEEELKAKMVWIEKPSIEQATNMFFEAFPCLNIGNTTVCGRERRIDQLQWRTCARIVRKQRKNRS